jgi:hypothetical protein
VEDIRRVWQWYSIISRKSIFNLYSHTWQTGHTLIPSFRKFCRSSPWYINHALIQEITLKIERYFYKSKHLILKPVILLIIILPWMATEELRAISMVRLLGATPMAVSVGLYVTYLNLCNLLDGSQIEVARSNLETLSILWFSPILIFFVAFFQEHIIFSSKSNLSTMIGDVFVLGCEKKLSKNLIKKSQ